MNADQRLSAFNPRLKVSFGEALDPLHSFLNLFHRRRVRDPNITFRSESRSISDDSVFFFE